MDQNEPTFFFTNLIRHTNNHNHIYYKKGSTKLLIIMRVGLCLLIYLLCHFPNLSAFQIRLFLPSIMNILRRIRRKRKCTTNHCTNIFNPKLYTIHHRISLVITISTPTKLILSQRCRSISRIIKNKFQCLPRSILRQWMH